MSTNGSRFSSNQSTSSAGSSTQGTLIPNRIFVGGISSNTSEGDLHSLFSKYGNVKSTKIIIDKAGISKGYGFVTFETEEETQRIQKEIGEIVLNDRKLNIAPAIKKQSYSRPAVADPVLPVPQSAILYPSSAPPTYGNAAAPHYVNSNLSLPQAAYPVIYPHQVFLPQNYYQPPTGATYPTQYVVNLPASSEASAYAPAMPYFGVRSSDYYAEASASELSNEDGKAAYSKHCVTQNAVASDYENGHTSPNKPGCNGTDTTGISSHGFHPGQVVHHPILLKKENGVTYMTCSNLVVIGTPTKSHVQDPNVQYRDNATDLDRFHLPFAAAAAAPTVPTTLHSFGQVAKR